ncbi:MAG: methyltransferase [Chlamydiales bacterium]
MPTHKNNWKKLTISPDETHHLFEGFPAYAERFSKVLKFHAPGFAPVQNETGAFHIDTSGKALYSERYLRTFGFYDSRASVMGKQGWFHLTARGKPLYSEQYAWTGNYQERCCAVRDHHGSYFHLNHDGQKAYQIPFRFAGDFRDGYAVVQNDEGLSTHINAEGKFLHNQWLVDLDVFHKGFARAKDMNGWFHINQSGKELYKSRFANIEPFYNGHARVESFDGMISIIDELGSTAHVLRSSQKDAFHVASAQLVSYWRLYTLHCAHDLKIFDRLPSTTEEIAQQLRFPIESVSRFFNALQEMRLIAKAQNSTYTLTETGSYFSSHHPHSLAKALQFWREEHHTSWLDLHDSLQTGENAFEKQHSINWFSWLRNHPKKNALFHEVMQTYAYRDYHKASSLLPMQHHTTALDLGGSTGILLIQLLNDYPHLKGILLDLPEIIAQNQFQDHLKDRIQSIGKDFFEPWPPLKADAIFLARILHDWSDVEATAILKKVHACLDDASHSRIYIIENLLNASTGAGGLLDLNMLVMTRGKERTFEQYQVLLTNADFILEKRIPLNEVTFILIAKRNHA